MRKALIIGIGLAKSRCTCPVDHGEEKENCETEYHACIRGAIELLYTVGGEAHDNGIKRALLFMHTA